MRNEGKNRGLFIPVLTQPYVNVHEFVLIIINDYNLHVNSADNHIQNTVP